MLTGGDGAGAFGDVAAPGARDGWHGGGGGGALADGADALGKHAGDPSTLPAASPVATPTALGRLCGASTIVDLSHTYGPDFPMYPGAQAMQINVLVTLDQGFFKNELILDEHTGTHMDAPTHFVEDADYASDLPVGNFVAPLAVLDISARAANDPDTQVTPDDILAWESQYGPLPAGAFVAMNSGWASRVNDADTFLNQDASDVPHFPGFHPDAALLVNERNIVGLGVDTVSLDFGAATVFDTHLTLLGAAKYGIENLANLDEAPPSGATVIIGGPKHETSSGGPTRVYALY